MKKSGNAVIKSKFFINRLVTYFSFLLIPIWIQKSINLNLFIQSVIIFLYFLFMLGQWYLMGKEIDHRFKIYYRVNSSMDRIVYRILSGKIFFILIYNFFIIFPTSVSKILFWSLFVLLGLFYSWPTRGKIIEESVAGQFGEFRFLDSFERTVLVLICLFYLISLPEIPLFNNIEALKLYFDPHESIHNIFWNLLTINYLPFNEFPRLFNLSWSLHIYLFGIGIFLMAFYGLLRFFFSRRLAILGVFAVVSSWSLSRILGADFIAAIKNTFPLLIIWSFLWASKSSTYRSGLIVGLVSFYGTMIDMAYSLLFPVLVFGGVLISLQNKTKWYRVQWLKYTILGGLLILILLLTHREPTHLLGVGIYFKNIYSIFSELIYRKSFLIISFLGFFMYLFYLSRIKSTKFTTVTFDTKKMLELGYGIVILTILAAFIDIVFINHFSAMWILVFFSLIPLEWIFQSISRLRSKRNIIYVLYILVCLLDSHLEGRARIVGKMFLNEDIFRYINQM